MRMPVSREGLNGWRKSSIVAPSDVHTALLVLRRASLAAEEGALDADPSRMRNISRRMTRSSNSNQLAAAGAQLEEITTYET